MKQLFFRSKSVVTERPSLVESPACSPDYLLVQSLLNDRIRANRLIQTLMEDITCPDYQRLVLENEFNTGMKPSVNKLRCILAIQEMNKCDGSKTEKLARARKIIANFVQCGSMFHIVELPPQLTTALLDGDAIDQKSYVYFTNLLDFCLKALLRNQVFMRHVRETL